MVIQLSVRGQTATSPEAINVFNFSATDTQMAADALELMYTTMAPFLSTAASFNVDPVARVYDTATGVLQGLESVTWTGAVPGAAGGTRGADATALLISWQTGVVVGGSLIQGRTYFPYPSLGVLGEGQVSGTDLADIVTAIGVFLPAMEAQGFTIWRRPVNGAGGASADVSQGIPRAEYGVQRRRRN